LWAVVIRDDQFVQVLNEVAGFLSSTGSHSLALIFYLIASHTALVINRSDPITLFEELYLLLPIKN